ncbi:2-dehydro-3-deoxygalactonokinase [Trinickia sp.]|uniref:2-dehydro-3-deoxygalactonokinase n=1 Tax=Trinickia sp. TaxID=2571163 RepID=UPI0039C944BC
MTAVQALAAPPALIGLDWGTTALRAYLFDERGGVIATRASGDGIMRLPQPGAFDAAFEAACGDWLDMSPSLPVIAAGMIGSAQGWREAPYVETPADALALVAGIVRVSAACGADIHIVPGVIEHGELPNVMRGEETQIVGALASAALDGETRALVGLPGTHAKWAVVRGERIESFHTFMTGEVYGALREHTILGRTMIEPAQFDTQAFLRGVAVAQHAHGAGLLATIFSTRTLGLTGELEPQQQPDYLSGLLIGHELAGLAALLASRGVALAGEAPRLIGSATLCERYRLALTQFGCLRASIVEAAAESGLWRLAVQAGLVGRRAFAPAG